MAEINRSIPESITKWKSPIHFIQKPRRTDAEILAELNACNEFRQNLMQSVERFHAKEQEQQKERPLTGLELIGLLLLALLGGNDEEVEE